MIEQQIKKGMSPQEIEQFVSNALSEMTLKEKAYIMTGHNFFKILLKDRGIGKRVVPGGGVERLGIPPFYFTDGPRGVVITGSTCLPVSMARGASWDVDLEEAVGEVIGKEVRAHGGNLYGGVCINLLRHPAWGRAQETYGEDPYHLGELGSALLRGVQKHNVMATIKHFAANSIEFSRFKVNVMMDERTLREVYLPHFKRCVENGCATVMSAYNKLNGTYCGHNSHLLRDILKGDWQFKGFVHSDWMNGLYDTIGGIKGGLDVEMPRTKHYGRKVIKAIQKGKISVDLINDSARRIIETVLHYTTRKDPQQYPLELIGCTDHVRIARKVAEKSMVLLKNTDDLLPLDTDNISKLLVLGKLADLKNTGDHGSSRVRQDNIITPLHGIRNLVNNNIEIAYDEGNDLKEVIRKSKAVDTVVIVVGYTYRDEGEYIRQFIPKIGDRKSLKLKDHDRDLIISASEQNPNVIVVLVGGSAIIMEEWIDKVKAVLMAWYSGMEGGTALANIIFGKVNPSGKLPFTIPKNESDLPFFKSHIDEIEYGYYHGYTLMDKKDIIPRFPFGFGLSYTQFEYENLTVKSYDGNIIASIDVTNTGKRAGEEIVQLYVGFENSKVDRPKKQLKGFEKILLEPGQTRNVSIQVQNKDLAWYNPETNKWEIEDINYTIYMGSSSKQEDLLSIEIKL
ncbi:MAG: glycoside hydrolase family 3 C-terminal domain-containing protein [Candidatus Lokiarchaeota archaeon]